ncbi:MAG TPA: alpha/beta fold hydrolase [Streptosporangiaceae bacterium]|nr:alpha/beta fold hydrolase [Streptosporangiaceae bacterium]
MAVEGVAFAVLLGLDGSPVWRAARVLVVIAVTAMAVWFTRRTGRAGQGATALLLGAVGTAAGAGVASGHLAKAGLDAAVAVAAIVLATGVALLGWGAATLVRAMPGWWRLLAVPGAVVLLWFVLWPLTIAVYATNLPPGPLGAATPSAYGFAYQDVAFSTADGVQLSAWYIPPRNGAAVVLLPGAGSTRTALLAQAAVLARHGYGAVLVDTRGHGRSGGHAMDFGWWGDRDIAAAVSFLARQPGVHAGAIALLGESMGGEQALAAAGSDPRIRAVVAEGATGQQLADHGWLPNGIDGVLERGMEWVQYTAAGLLSGAPRPASIRDGIRAAAPRPVLIIAGGAVADEPVAARWFQAASPATVQVWVVPRAGHTRGLATAPRAWEARVISFLNAALKPSTR